METIYIVDAFTDRAFAGNPAAVCVLDSARDDRWLQQVAMELNQSETAFIWPRNGHFDIRWFTPDTEEDLCGHATLASAHILWERGYLDAAQSAVFDSRSGRLGASKMADGSIVLDFPAEPAVPCALPPGLAALIGFDEQAVYFVGKNRLDYFIELSSEALVRALRPDYSGLRLWQAPESYRGVIVTAAGGAAFDCVSRFFCTEPTVPEDPVTGSAHCCIGPYWGDKTGKRELLAYQASARGGVLHLGLRDNRVQLGGQALTVLAGQLLV